MKFRLFTSLFVLTGILVFGGLVHAGSTVIQVTDNFYEDSLPQIKGDYVVWQGKVNGDWDVFICNIYTPEALIQIADNDYDDVAPQTDGNYVAWLGDSSAGGEIFLYNVESGSITQITDNDNVDSPPQIADGRVVWASQEVSDSVEPGEIMLYHISTGVTEQLTDDTLDDSDPKIDSNTVFWVQTDEEETTRLLIHDITAGTTTEAPEDFVWGESPQTDGNLTVLTRHDGDDREVFLLNSASRRYHQVTDNDLEDTYPSISGNNMAWMAGGEIFLGEYEYLGLSRPADNAVLSNDPPATFAWEGIGYEKYKVEFSSLALPPGNDSFLLQTSLTPTGEDWKAIRTIGRRNGSVHWRVEGVRSDGSVSYSETWSFIIKEPGEIATGITNEDTDGSGGGPCFIGAAAFD
jgi:beta propeller repeat protein